MVRAKVKNWIQLFENKILWKIMTVEAANSFNKKQNTFNCDFRM
jgi:hypothetical protein